jgi:hypothetical protein
MESQVAIYPGSVFVLLVGGLAVLLSLGVIVLTILVYCKIFAKAGFPWALGLLQLLPVVNLVMLIYLAFAEWPVQRELRQLKQHVSARPL